MIKSKCYDRLDLCRDEGNPTYVFPYDESVIVYILPYVVQWQLHPTDF